MASIHTKRVPVKWESVEEWDLEQRVFQCNEKCNFNDISELLNELWFQYVEAKKIEVDIDELAKAVKFFDKVKSSSQEDQIAVGVDHWNRLVRAARNVVTEKEKIYE